MSNADNARPTRSFGGRLSVFDGFQALLQRLLTDAYFDDCGAFGFLLDDRLRREQVRL